MGYAKVKIEEKWVSWREIEKKLERKGKTKAGEEEGGTERLRVEERLGNKSKEGVSEEN